MSKFINILRNWWYNLNLGLFGCCKINDKYYVKCDIHGITLGYKCGYEGHVICTDCMKQLAKDSYEYHLTQLP